MKNIGRLFLILFVTASVLSSCEDEDVIRYPEYITPAILLATDVQGNQWTRGQLDGAAFTFTLNEENFDGAADGHKFFVGREGNTSTLLDATLLVSYNGSTPAPVVTINSFPTNVSITPAMVASAVGINVADIEGGDRFVITYEYNIDANNTGDILLVTTPSTDWCQGSTNEGEWCSFNIDIVCSQVIASPPGDYTINFFDSYGDGWNGAAIRFVEDGANRDFTLVDGSAGSEVVTVPAGVSTLTFEYVSGDWDSEASFEIISPAGNVIASGGPSQEAGVTLQLNLCDE